MHGKPEVKIEIYGENLLASEFHRDTFGPVRNALKEVEMEDTASLGTESFTNRVSAELAKRGMSQSELAEKAGLSKPFVCRFLNGNRLPTHDVVTRIAHALNTTAGDFVQGTNAEAVFSIDSETVPSVDYKRLEELLTKVASDLEALKADHEAIKKVHFQLGQDHSALRTERDQALSNIASLELQLESLTREKQEWEQERRRLTGEKSRIEEDERQLRMENATMEGTLASLQKAHKDLKASEQQLRTEARDLASKLDASARDSKRFQAELHSARQAISQFERNARDANIRADEAERRCDELQERISNLEEVLTRQKQRSLELYEEYRKASTELQRVTNKSGGDAIAIALLSGVIGGGLGAAAATAMTPPGRRRRS